ncbi:integrase [Vibrio lentus]
MLVAIDNYTYLEELTQDVIDNPTLLNDMHVDTLSQLTSYAVEKDDFRVLALLTEIHTGIPMHRNNMPDWWLSDFYGDVSEIKFEHQKNIKVIRWCDIKLSDGAPLTSDNHQPLLNAFKHWLLACDNPLNNGGKVVTSNAAGKKFNRILTLINVILLNAETLKLSEYHLEKVTDEFWLKVLLAIAGSRESAVHDLYQTYTRIENLLNSVDVSEDELEAFTEKYPCAGRDVDSESILLNLDDRVKACCWLEKQKYYSGLGCNTTGSNKNPQGIGTVLIDLLFKGKIITDRIAIPSFPELALRPKKIRTEYPYFPNNERGKGTSSEILAHWVAAIKLINTNVDRNDIGHFNPVTSDVSVDAIQGLDSITLRKQGRTKTLPPEFVLSLFRDSYHLISQFCPGPKEKGMSFLDNMVELLTEASKKSVENNSNLNRPSNNSKYFDEALHRELPQSELAHWLRFEAANLIHTDFKKQGVTQFESILFSDEIRHDRIRHNESMMELFKVIQGAVQLLLGSIMARRQDELVQLKPYGNLIYIDNDGKRLFHTSPFDKKEERWSLQFKVKKTGTKGKNLTAERPIPQSIACIIWQLEQFNQQVIKKGLAKEKTLVLFNYIDTQKFKLKKGGPQNFNGSLDALCDYFETTIVEMSNGEYHRHYIREHQLRRFFALVFFWSKNYEDMESLRWMLAHSDLEHLHSYITDNIDGSIINSTKASTIVQSVISNESMINNFDELDKLRKLLAKRLTGNAAALLIISTLDDVTFDYENESEYKTCPHISQLQAEHDIETQVLTLLENGSITLQPEFFTIKDENGDEYQNFNLILKVNELECY